MQSTTTSCIKCRQRRYIQLTGRTPHPIQCSIPYAPSIARCTAGNKSQDLLQPVRIERATIGMLDQPGIPMEFRNANTTLSGLCAATQRITEIPEKNHSRFILTSCNYVYRALTCQTVLFCCQLPTNFHNISIV